MFMTVTGLEEVRQTLGELAPRVATNLMRTVVQDIASSIAKEAKAAAPVRSGGLKKAIKAQRRRSSRDNPQSQVKANAKNTDKGVDAFYWKFIEFGTRKMQARPFIAPIKQKYAAQMPRILKESFGKKLEQYLARQANRAARARNR